MTFYSNLFRQDIVVVQRLVVYFFTRHSVGFTVDQLYVLYVIKWLALPLKTVWVLYKFL